MKRIRKAQRWQEGTDRRKGGEFNKNGCSSGEGFEVLGIKGGTCKKIEELE